jgi:hypothetical protein
MFVVSESAGVCVFVVASCETAIAAQTLDRPATDPTLRSAERRE